MDVSSADLTHEVLPANSLTPITTSTTTHTVSEPQRVIIVSGSTASTLAIVVVLVEESATGGSTLRDALAVLVGVDVNASGRALEETLVADSPADDLDVDVAVGEVVEAVEPLEPDLVLGLECGFNLLALGLGHGGAGFPSNAHVDGSVWLLILVMSARARESGLPLVGNELIPTIVLKAKEISIVVGLLAMVPNLLQRRGEGRRRVPARLSLHGSISTKLRQRSSLNGRKSLPNRCIEIGGGRES